MNIKIAKSDNEILNCYPVMRELRPHIQNNEFLDRFKYQEKNGYKIAFLEVDNVVVAVAGFRLGDSLAWGHFLYIDDLVTLAAHRSCGYGKALLDWLREFAKQERCQQLHLDSGLQRKDAHRFYKREGIKSEGFHFVEMIDLNN